MSTKDDVVAEMRSTVANWRMIEGPTQRAAKVAAWADRLEALAPAGLSDGENPPLPSCWTGSPVTVTWAEDGETSTREVYTAEQMVAYRRLP